MTVPTLNGSTGAVYSALAGAAAVGGILFNQVYRAIDDLQDDVRMARVEARDARSELRADMIDRFRLVDDTFRARGAMIEANKSAIVALQSSDVEIETQLRSIASMGNLEKQYQQSLQDLLQQCGEKCKLPERTYYPPGPGPGGTNGQH